MTTLRLPEAELRDLRDEAKVLRERIVDLEQRLVHAQAGSDEWMQRYRDAQAQIVQLRRRVAH